MLLSIIIIKLMMNAPWKKDGRNCDTFCLWYLSALAWQPVNLFIISLDRRL